jgi:Tol biopolymer transport system component
MSEKIESPDEKALESWKEIAAYLKRDVRTVIRWEKSEGLPVHRHLHQARSSVYAYPSEISAWSAARRPRREPVAAWRRVASSLAFAAVLMLSLLLVADAPFSATAAAALQSPATTRPVLRQIWTPAVDQYLGVLSLDGRYLGFRDGATGDLVVRDLTEGTDLRLTNTGGWVASGGDHARNPVISPDGRQVAYAWFTGKTRQVDLRILPLSAGEPIQPRVLYRGDEAELEPRAWSPDGKQLLVLRTLKDDTNQIAMVSVQDGTIRVLKSLDWRHPGTASLSPDGRSITYDFPAAANVAARNIFLLASDGSRESVIVQNSADDQSPLWSPDGSKVLFLSDRTGRNALWAVPIDGGRAAGPAESVKADIDIREFSILGMTRSGALYYVSGGGRRRVYVAELDATAKAAQAPVPVAERFIDSAGAPAWSPDGQYLAYLSFRSPRSTVLIVRTLKTGEERDIPLRLLVGNGYANGSAEVVPVQWFPDGGSVLVVSDEPSRPGLGYYRVSLTSGNAELLHYTRTKSLRSHQPALSPDGKAIFYIERFGDEETRLMRFDLDARREREMRRTVGPQAITSLAVSADGAHMAYFLWSCPNYDCVTSIEVMPAGGGEVHEVFRRTYWDDWSRIGGLAWTRDQRYLLFARRETVNVREFEPRANLWRVPVIGGEPEYMGISVAGRLHFPQVHPDSRRIAFEARESAPREVWALENFLAGLK